jgi:hypothetical protein
MEKITNIEIWFHRIVIIFLAVFVLLLAKGINQAQDMALKNMEFILDGNKSVVDLYAQNLSTGIILRGMSDDYPPKMKLGERDWCLERSCLTPLQQ